jgi:hypothetical protein
MKIAIVTALAAALSVPAAAQMTIQHLPKPVPRAVHVQSPKAVLLSETAELCAARNKFLREKVTPALRNQLAQLQSQIADKRAHSFSCSPDLTRSVSGDGAATDCGIFACNPLDGLCRAWAKTSDDCAPGYLWNGYRSCVPATP